MVGESYGPCFVTSRTCVSSAGVARSPTRQASLSQVDMPSFGRTYACSRNHARKTPNTINTSFIGTSFRLLQHTAETAYAQEKPREDGPQEDAAVAPTSSVGLVEENIDSRRSRRDAPHLGHSSFSLSENTISSNSAPHFRQQNSYKGICSS